MSVVFLTSDWCMHQPGPHGLDPEDRRMIPPGATLMFPSDAVALAAVPPGPAEPEGDLPAGHRSVDSQELQDLAARAAETQERFREVARGLLRSPLRVAMVRRWRVDERRTWRGVARAAEDRFDAVTPWWPPSNQVMGMALCEVAAGRLGEDWRAAPWNGPAS